MQEELVFINCTDDRKELLNELLASVIDNCVADEYTMRITLKNDSWDTISRIKILQQFTGNYIEGKKENTNA
ncbi:MAG: hypothetical protein IJM91_07490 [Lachnospiraceae bacterium]|nr:hypothetical protein [Lachnospiraceae bacterium]